MAFSALARMSIEILPRLPSAWQTLELCSLGQLGKRKEKVFKHDVILHDATQANDMPIVIEYC